jgi:RHS repeat-associated protein
MGRLWQSLVGYVACCCLVGLAVFVPAAFAEGSSALGGTGSSSLENPLVVPQAQSLFGGAGVSEAEDSRRASPEAAVLRQESQTKYEGLSTEEAAKLAGEAFPAIVDHAAGGLPSLPEGQHITSIIAADSAQVDVGEGREGVVQSMVPIATESAPGQWSPVDLGVSEVGGVFRVANPVVGVGIPKQLQEGVGLAGTGVSLVPVVSGSGVVVGGSEGRVDGSVVFYGGVGVGSDVDEFVKPETYGFSEDAILRSAASPEQLFYRVGLPEGASLVQAKGGSGAVEVVDEGSVIASVLAPHAQDAAGTPVGVSLSVVSGDVVELTVDRGSGEYLFPIEVDPTVTDSELLDEEEPGANSNWAADTSNGTYGPFCPYEEPTSKELIDTHGRCSAKNYERGEWGAFGYATQGASHIYGFVSETSGTDSESNIENNLFIASKGSGVEEAKHLPASYSNTKTEVCVKAGCATGTVTESNEGNQAQYQQLATNSGNGFTSVMTSAAVEIVQEKEPTVSFDTTDATLDGEKNVLYGSGSWLGKHSSSGMWEAVASDSGIGVSEIDFTSPNSPGWELKEPYLWPSYKALEACRGVQCKPSETWGPTCCESVDLPNGEDTLEVKAKNATGEDGTAKTKIKVDFAPPYNITLAGLPANHEIGSGTYHFKISATDGSGSTPSSGVASIALEVDGKEIGKPSGSCSPGPCTASGEWTVSGTEFGAGTHTITMVAVDNAGNEGDATTTMYVARPTSPVAVGPGSVNPASGELSLETTDVSVGGPGGALAVGRSYGSLHAAEGPESPLGPGWVLALGGAQSITKLPNGNMLLTAGSGLQSVFASKGGGEFTPPKGDENLVLTEVEKEKAKEFSLKVGGSVTTFKLPSGGTGSTWVPVSSEGPGTTGVVTYAYQTTKENVTEPTEELAPVAAGVSCSAKLEKGCRALTFSYASSTTATGEASSEWGEYNGRLAEVSFTAWNTSLKEMTSTAVAEYAYDKQGRLRAEWDPRVSPALKTTYGYDSEDHVSALTPPGQQPWLITYGERVNDTRTGHLLAVTRPSASTAAGDGKAPVSTTAPALSTTSPVEGSTLSVSTGSWSNSPLSYGYQWEECEGEVGKEVCAPIVGATNQTYMPIYHRSAYSLKVQVTATDSDGSTVASSNTSAHVLPKGFFEEKLKFGTSGSGKLSKPAAVAVDPSGDVWVADTGDDRIVEFSATGTYLAAYGKEGSGEVQFKEPKGIAIDKYGNVYVADAGNSRIEVLNSSGKYVTQKATTAAPAGIAIGIQSYDGFETEELYVAIPSKDEIAPFEISRKSGVELAADPTFGKEGSGEEQFKDPTGVATGDAKYERGNYIYVSDTGNDRVEVFEPLGLLGLVKYRSQFGKEGKGEGQFSSPGSLAFEPERLSGPYAEQLAGGLFVTDTGNSRVQQFNSSGSYQNQLAVASGSQGIAFNAASGASEGDMYLASNTENAVEQWTPGQPPTSPPEPPKPGTSAVTTIEYHVPVSGTGAPYGMGSTEVEAWAQKDDPVEATAIFPPDEPEGWPAKDYKRATVYYLDSAGHTVNVAHPSGGISTSEYNTTDDVARTLSPDNRAAALKEGSKSAEASQKLATESTYNTEGSELLSTLGPLHTVKLANHTQIEARAHTVYSYNEGAPSEGGPYNLVTKVTSGAENTSKEEFDMRTTATAHSGQANLGWKLRKPTSVTIEPAGLKLTTTALYNEETGAVTETRPATGTSGESSAPVYSTKFGSSGSGAGQFSVPIGMAVEANGDVWVADNSNNRLEKFSSSGSFIEAVGWGVSDGKEKAEVCTSSCQAGIAGSGEGQFKGLKDVAINPSTGNLYVDDSGNGRVEELSSSGTFVRAFGTTGTGTLKSPDGLTIGAGGVVWVADSGNNRIVEFSETGGYETSVGSEGSGNLEFKEPKAVAISGGNLYVDDFGNNRIEELSTKGTYLGQFGSLGSGNGQLKEPSRIAVDPLSGDLYVADHGNNRMEEFNPDGAFLAKFGQVGKSEGQFENLKGVTISPTGAIYVSDAGNERVQEFVPPAHGYTGAHDTQTIYYTAGANAMVASCGEHPEWANLVCQTQPLAQPEDAGLPELPVTTTTYNMWDEPETTTQTVGSTTRTTTNTYDTAGRLKTTAISSTVGTALPTVTDEYNKETGALEKQSTTTESKTKTVTSTTNKLGQLTSYTDADENTATYTYDIDGRPEKTNDGKGTQTYTYNTTTGLLTQLVDSAAGTFTASYDIEGNMLTEGYPNGMTATYTLNRAGEATGLEYVKTTHCTEKCAWFSDTVIPSIHGEWQSQTDTTASIIYTYDNAGRLTQVEETPLPIGTEPECKHRGYTYDEDTNRTEQTLYNDNEGGYCVNGEGGTTEHHTYDTADRLTDTGTAYNTFGDTTSLPAADAGGSELTSAYYVDNQLATQTQNGETIGYNLDPSGRTREIVSTGKTSQDIINHYAAPGDTPAWTIETPSGNWTRNIKGINGGLAAIQLNGATPVLQLTNLHGDIIATAALNETETKLLSMTNTSEYGVPTTSTPAKYSWLGAEQQPTELPSGVIQMGARSYIPQLGRFLQTDPIPGGSADAYAYTDGNPVNESDPSGALSWGFSKWAVELDNQMGQEVIAREAAREAAEKAAREAAARAEAEHNAATASGAGGYEESPGEWEEEGGSGCIGQKACAASFSVFGFKVEVEGVIEWWKKVKKGYELIRETLAPGLKEAFRENSTVCKAVGYATAAGSYFIPESEFAKAVGVAVGFGVTYGC